MVNERLRCPTCNAPDGARVSSDRREKWATTDDHGNTRWVVVDYDERGVAEVTREAMHDLLTYAGMRLTMEADE